MKKEKYKKYKKIINPILEHPEFQKRKKYKHHGKITVYEHSIKVSLLAYKMAYYLPKVDQEKTAIGGLLHDFYDKPWMENIKKEPLLKKHGFVHAKQAKNNAIKYFPNLIDKKIANMIERHMFPLNIIPPKYIESWIITISDKIISLETLFDGSTFLYILGFKKGSENIE